MLDTNIVLYLLSGDTTVAEFVNGKQIYISFITELELLGHTGITEVEVAKINDFLEECGTVNITEQIKEKTLNFRRSYKLKLPDCIIAATSEYLGLPLMTADGDFKKVEEINVVHFIANEKPSDFSDA